MAFIKNIVELSKASHVWILYTSWVIFVLAISSTLMSYLFGQSALNKQRFINEKYYLEGDEGAGEQVPFASKITRFLSYVSVFTYIAAVSFTALFIALNLVKGVE